MITCTPEELAIAESELEQSKLIVASYVQTAGRYPRLNSSIPEMAERYDVGDYSMELKRRIVSILDVVAHEFKIALRYQNEDLGKPNPKLKTTHAAQRFKRELTTEEYMLLDSYTSAHANWKQSVADEKEAKAKWLQHVRDLAKLNKGYRGFNGAGSLEAIRVNSQWRTAIIQSKEELAKWKSVVAEKKFEYQRLRNACLTLGI